MKVSLIISTFNQVQSLDKVLQGVLLQTRVPDEILIADDGSDPPTANLIQKFAAHARTPVHHVWQPHQGFRKTIILNQALARSRGEYLIFTDGDCVPHPRFVEDHAALAERGFWVQGRRCFVLEPHVPAFSPGLIPPWRWMLAGRISGAAKGIRLPCPLVQRDTRQRGIIGCNMAFWRDDLLAINGYDEDYSGWGTGEDSDVGSRLYHLGRMRKFVYGRAITFHLNHPPAPKGHHSASLEKLQATLRSRKIRCLNGVDKHYHAKNPTPG